MDAVPPEFSLPNTPEDQRHLSCLGFWVLWFWGFGVLGFCGFGVLGFWVSFFCFFGDFWGSWVLGLWGFEVLGFWGFGVLGVLGVLGCWGVGVLGVFPPTVLHNGVITFRVKEWVADRNGARGGGTGPWFRRSRCSFARIPLRFDAPAVVSREFRCISMLPLWFRANSGLSWPLPASSGGAT